MHAHKLNITIPADHEVAIRLPDDFPAGPAEIIVLATRTPVGEAGRQDEERERAAGLERTVLAAAQVVQKVAAALPVDEEDERLVDALFAKSTASLRTRPLTRREGGTG